tara:strand:- start:4420 stop:6597 length:2178 start_codon:yes stop_codon:yes gene_type:complete
MKTPGKLEIKPFIGIDERIPAPSNSTQLIENLTYDAHTKTWNNFLGFEEFFHTTNRPYGGSGVSQIYDPASIDSIYCYQRHNSAQQWFLFEQEGKLKYLVPSSGQAANQVAQTLEEERHIPTIQEAHTNYTPYGRYVIITNGVDGPLKYRGGDRIYPLGWDRRPGSPEVITPFDYDSNNKPMSYVEALSDFELGNNELGGGSLFKSQVFQGVGFVTGSDGQNEYKYKVSFVNEAGSESPISEASRPIKWTTKDITKGTNEYANRACPVMEIPVGPQGVVARKLYRTNNGGSDFFFLDQIDNNTDDFYVDFRQDTQLGSSAPLDSESIVMPANGGRFTATFKNCLFIDGGISDGTRIYYSQPNQPDTFKDSNFFDVGTREGGDITGFEVYYNSLLVFREQAIDLIRGDALNGFELVPFITGIGCRSPHSVVNVPTIGIMFLGQDGVYCIKGGLDGGANLQIEKKSDPIQQYIERLSLDGLASAVSIYSSQWREVHFYVAADDGHRLTMGLIYHIDSASWSFRDNKEWGVNCITTDKDSNLIYGRWYDQDPAVVGQTNRGIYVISRKRTAGTFNAGNDEVPDYQDAAMPPSKIRTQWLDFGQPFLKKNIKYVYLYILTTGNQVPSLGFYKDREWDNESDAQRNLMQRADHRSQPVYEPVDPDQEDSQALWGTAKWQNKLLTQVRYAVDLKAVSEFAFEIEAFEAFTIMGYAVEYTANGTETIRGRQG